MVRKVDGAAVSTSITLPSGRIYFCSGAEPVKDDFTSLADHVGSQDLECCFFRPDLSALRRPSFLSGASPGIHQLALR